MSTLARILVPTDFSPACGRALERAVAVAARTGAELHVLHVQVLHRSKYGWAAVPVIADVEKVIADLSRKDLDAAVQGIRTPLVSEVMQSLEVGPAIVHYSGEHDIDLIVMGTHTRSDFSRMFLGSVAAEVVRESPVSVLVIGAEHPLPSDNYRHVLAPVDFSESSTLALRQAANIARGHEAKLTVMHVVEPPKAVPYISMRESAEALHARATAALDSLLESVGLPPAAAQRLVVIGQPEREIVWHAREQRVDLLVMSTVGLSGLSRLLLGSTTERVLRNAPCAVLAQRGAMLDDL